MLGLFEKTHNAVQRTRDSWFGKVTRLFERAKVSDALWEELEELLISADVGVTTAGKLITLVRERTRKEGLNDPLQLRTALKQEMVRMLNIRPAPLAGYQGPLVIMVVGVNGSGKTTSIAKLARHYKGEGKSVLLAAGDTFRAAAVEQLQAWGRRVGVEVVAHQPGGDPGAVVFDALQAALSRKTGVVIVDTAGRLHTKFNLMEELKKMKRVASRAGATVLEVILVLDATTGQNGLTQAKYFTETVELTGIFLSKLDGTAKGGVVLAICDQLNLPLLFIGTGEGVDDIAPFDPEAFVDALFIPEEGVQPRDSAQTGTKT
ncbi:MAG: signal recognition particle-docking protein FtsY [Chloroflexota bacterium]